MKVFTIENGTNNITVFGSVQEAETIANAELFRSEAGLAKLAADWPMMKLVEIWNSLPGAEPVKKFKDRNTGVSRIWKQIQSLEPALREEVGSATEPSGHAAPLEAEPAITEDAATPEGSAAEAPTAELAAPDQQGEEHVPGTTANVAPQGGDVAPEPASSTKKTTRAKKPPTEPKKATTPRAESKTAQVITMLKREQGTTVEEIMTAMGWLKHTTRALLSAGGSLTKNHGLTVQSEKAGEVRRYYIKG
jgi:hypothetical protein